jgi:hypothetical protein
VKLNLTVFCRGCSAHFIKSEEPSRRKARFAYKRCLDRTNGLATKDFLTANKQDNENSPSAMASWGLLIPTWELTTGTYLHHWSGQELLCWGRSGKKIQFNQFKEKTDVKRPLVLQSGSRDIKQPSCVGNFDILTVVLRCHCYRSKAEE